MTDKSVSTYTRLVEKVVNGHKQTVIEIVPLNNLRTPENTSSPLLWLPEELLLTIFSSLSPKEVGDFSQLNKNFYQLTKKPLLWRFYVKKYCLHFCFPQLFNKYEKIAKELMTQNKTFDWKNLYINMLLWKQSKIVPIKLFGGFDQQEEYEYIYRENDKETNLDLHYLSRNRILSITNSHAKIFHICQHENGEEWKPLVLQKFALANNFGQYFSRPNYIPPMYPRTISLCNDRNRVIIHCQDRINVYNISKTSEMDLVEDLLEYSIDVPDSCYVKSNENNLIYIGTKGKKTISLYNQNNGKKKTEFAISNVGFLSAADSVKETFVTGSSHDFPTDQKILLKSKKDQYGELKVWDISQGKCITKLWSKNDKKMGQVSFVKLSQDQNTLISLNNETTIDLWDLRTKNDYLSIIMNPHQQEPQDTRHERTVKCFITPCLPYLVSSISNNIYICDIRKSSTVLWSHIDPKYQYTQHNQIHGTNLSIPYKTDENKLLFANGGCLKSINIRNPSSVKELLVVSARETAFRGDYISSFDFVPNKIFVAADNATPRVTCYYRTYRIDYDYNVK